MPNLFAQFSEDEIRHIAARHPQASPAIRMQWLDNINRRVMDEDYRTSRNEVGHREFSQFTPREGRS